MSYLFKILFFSLPFLSQVYAQSETHKKFCNQMVEEELNYSTQSIENNVLTLGHISSEKRLDCFEMSKDKVSTLLGKKYCQGEGSRLDIIAFEEISVAHTKESKKEAKCIAWKKAVFERYRNLSLGRVLGLWENEKEIFLSTLKNLQVIPFSISSLFSENNQFKLKIDDIVTELYDLEEQKIQWEQEQDQSKSFEEFIEKKARSFLASYEVHPSDSQHFSCLGEKTTSSLELFRQMWKIQENLYRKTGDKLIINPESTPQIEISNSAYILKIEVGNCQYSGSEPASH